MGEWWEFLTRYASDVASASWLKAVLGVGITAFATFLGLPNPAVEALLLLMVSDYVFGAAHAWKEDRLQFVRLRRGLGKFIVYGVTINIVTLADRGMGVDLVGFSLRNLLCGYLCANEALSALTHLGEFGVPIPPWIMQRLRSYRKSIEDKQVAHAPCEPPDHEE